MYIVFVFIVLLTLFLLVFRRRYLDFISLYTFCLFLFNITTFFGVVNDPVRRVFVEPNPFLYFISSIPFLCVIPFLLIGYNKEKLTAEVYKYEIKGLIKIFLFLSTLFFLLAMIDNKEALFYSQTKVDVLENSTLSRNLFRSLPPVGLIISIHYKNKTYALFFLLAALLVFFTGSRSPLAVLGLCLFIYLLYPKKIVIVDHLKLMFFGLLGLLIIILGKRLYGSILYVGFFDGFSYWIDNFDFQYLIEGSEFLGTPAILNEVIDKDFDISNMDIIHSLLAILPIPMSFWGLSSGLFNDRFQPILFPTISYGMAFNIWAEAFSWLGVFGVVIYSILIPLFLYSFWKSYMKYRNKLWGGYYLLLGVTLSFLVHRNSLGSILGSMRNIIYPLVLLIFFSKLIYYLLKIKK